MKAVSILSMRTKRGSPHIWVESIATRRAGFEPGVRFSVEMHGSGVLLRVADDGGLGIPSGCSTLIAAV